MDRRKLIKTGLLGSLTLLSLRGWTSTKTGYSSSKTLYNGYLTITFNDLELVVLSDGAIRMDKVQPTFAPLIDPKKVKKELRSLFIDDEKLHAAMNILLIKKDNQNILIDTGCGFHLGSTGGKLVENLKSYGIDPSEVDKIIISHAHFDHIGGIRDEKGNLIFENAQYYISEEEFNFWRSDNPDFSKCKNPEGQKDNIDLARNTFSKINNKLSFFEYDKTLFSCIRPVRAAGHTPGHTLFEIFSGDRVLTHIADTIHSPLLVTKPEWGTQWDINFEEGIVTRERILSKLYENKDLLFSSHLPWPGLGYINMNNDHFQYIPKFYYMPDKIEE